MRMSVNQLNSTLATGEQGLPRLIVIHYSEPLVMGGSDLMRMMEINIIEHMVL